MMEIRGLTFPDFEKVFQVNYDTIWMAIEVVLSQEGQSIPFFSEKLDEAKQKYLIYDQR